MTVSVADRESERGRAKESERAREKMTGRDKD